MATGILWRKRWCFIKIPYKDIPYFERERVGKLTLGLVGNDLK